MTDDKIKVFQHLFYKNAVKQINDKTLECNYQKTCGECEVFDICRESYKNFIPTLHGDEITEFREKHPEYFI